jgi:hypothetical protein
VIEFAKKGHHTVVDLGCCRKMYAIVVLMEVGTDVREFVLDGGHADGKNKIVAVDLRQGYLELGQELFKGPTPGINFRAADLLDPLDKTLDDIKGKVTILYTGAVFHLFTEDKQRTFADGITRLISRDRPAVLFGLHRGAKVKGPRISSSGRAMFAHDPESWEELWQEVLGEDANNWDIRATLRDTWTAAEIVTPERLVLQWSLWRK